MKEPATTTLAQPAPLNGASGLSPRPATPRGSKLVSLTLLDILPDRKPAVAEHRDSWWSLGEINAEIISNLSIYQATAT